MGSVRKDDRGSGWQARYRDRSGRQRTRSFDSKGDARRYLDSSEVDLAQGTWTDPSLGKVRFSAYATRWRESVAHLRPGTLVNLDSRLHKHVLPAFSPYAIGSIEPADIRAWVATLVGSGLAPSTVASTYHVLARIMATAETDGVVPRTPCRGIRLPRIDTTIEMCFLNPSEVRSLAEAIEPRYQALIFTAAYTGLRWGELAGLRTAHLNLLHGAIDVVEALTEVNGHLALGPTKTGKRRRVSLPPFLVDLLENHGSTFGSPESYVFSSAKGTPLRRSFYPRHFKPAVRRSDAPDRFRFHDLRHTCAALLIAQGAHPKEIQERLGHSTIRLTFDRYGHLFPGLDERLRDGLDLAYRSAEPTKRGEVIPLAR
jgi:integrase